MSIGKTGWANFRCTPLPSQVHDESEVKRKKPRWLSARPRRWPESTLLEFNKNPRASPESSSLAELCRGTLCVSALPSVHRPSILFRFTFPIVLLVLSRSFFFLCLLLSSLRHRGILCGSITANNSQINCIVELVLGYSIYRLFLGKSRYLS